MGLLDESKLADELGIKPTLLRDWRSAGLGPPYIKVGRQVRYSADAVEEWLAAHTVAGDRQPA